MGSQYNHMPLNYICQGCLSMDRKLITVYDVQQKQMFVELQNFLDQMNGELLLCWECTAVLRSVLRFKNRVRAAHDSLVRYMVCQTTHISPLSTLTKTIVKTTDHPHSPDDDDKSMITTEDTQKTATISFDSEINSSTDIINFNVPQIRKATSYFSQSGFSDVPLKTKVTGFNNVNSDVTRDGTGKVNHNEPIFVKIEDNELENEYFYEDENIVNSVEDKGVATEVKSDNSHEVVVSSKTSKVKKKRKKVVYDASDDEPLKPSKKERKGRSKKGETEDESVKKRRSKREKPAGVVTNSRVNRNLEQLNVAEGQIEMVVLSWEEVEAERQKALASVVFTRHEYRCYDCALGFNHRFKLENHMNKHAPAAGAAECPVCHIRCRDDHALVAHKRRHRVRWRCVQCGEAASRAAVAADHAARAHGATPTHACRRCGLTLQSLAKLRNHMKNHAERQKCELCGKTFRDRTSLRTHLFIHRGEKEYACTHCDKKFLFKKAMEVHLVTHSAPAQLYCLECDMTFKNSMSYYQHKKYNLKHIDPAKLKYQCPLCDKKFLKAVRLEEHNFAVHLKVTPIRCTTPGCDFACSSRPVLRTHVRMVHRNLRAVRNHVCDTCGKAYTTKKTLEGHMRSHTGERPFHCGLCPSTFSYEAALYNHNKLVHLKGKTVRPAAAAPLTG